MLQPRAPYTSTLAESYARFVPARLVRHHAVGESPPTALRVERCRGAVLFADILGYTALTEALSRRGPEGIEHLKLALNQFFNRLETVIEELGGDIISFAGDSLLAIWTSDEGDTEAICALLAA